VAKYLMLNDTQEAVLSAIERDADRAVMRKLMEKAAATRCGTNEEHSIEGDGLSPNQNTE